MPGFVFLSFPVNYKVPGSVSAGSFVEIVAAFPGDSSRWFSSTGRRNGRASRDAGCRVSTGPILFSGRDPAANPRPEGQVRAGDGFRGPTRCHLDQHLSPPLFIVRLNKCSKNWASFFVAPGIVPRHLARGGTRAQVTKKEKRRINGPRSPS